MNIISLDNLANNIIDISNTITDNSNNSNNIYTILLTLNNKVDLIMNKLEILERKLDTDIVKECKKMGSHIDFVEEVYDNVKHPLGYICKKITYLTGKTNNQYSLTDKSNLLT